MIKIRQSALNSYETCPRLFYEEWGEVGTQEREDDEMPTNKYASTGVTLHHAMEIWGLQKRMGNNMTLLQIHDILDHKFFEIPPELFADEEDRNKYRNSLHEQIDWLYDKCCQTKPLYLEHKFDISDLIEGLPPFTGTIDRIDGDMQTQNIEILDYKSGKVYTRNELKSNMQATIYALAFKRLFGFYPAKFTFLFSKFKKEKTILITDEFIDEGITRIKSNWFHIANGDFDPPARPNLFFCNNFCNYKKNCPRHKKRKGWEGVDVV